MSDKLFPEKEDGKKEYEYEDGSESLLDKITNALPEIPLTGKEGQGEEKENKSTSTGLGLGKDKDEEEETWKDKIDRFTVIVVSIELVLLLYFMLALLGFVPFF